MKLALLVSAVLCCASSSSASSFASVTKSAASQSPTQIVPPATLTGQGYGAFTLPGLADGQVVAHLFDQLGIRRYQLMGSVVYTVPETDGRERMQGAFHGALLAPGESLQVEGTWMMSADGHGVLAAVVFGPAEEGGAGPKIGKILGAFALPGAETLCHADLISPPVVKSEGPRLARRSRPIIKSLGNDYIDPHLTGLTVPLDLRWKLIE